MTREQQKRNAQGRADFTAEYGTDPITAGVIGSLADHECKHGFLPTDRNRTCQCFPRRRGKR